MAIYSRRSGDKCKVVRLAVIDDIKRFERRRADKSDKQNVANCSYVICEWEDGTGEFLAALWFLTADGGFAEIQDAITASVGRDMEALAKG